LGGCFGTSGSRISLGSRGKEVAAAVPLLDLLHVHQADVGLMDQGRRLQRLARLFLSELRGRQPPQLVIDQRQQLFGGVRIAVLDGAQNLGHVGHGFKFTSGSGVTQPVATLLQASSTVGARLKGVWFWFSERAIMLLCVDLPSSAGSSRDNHDCDSNDRADESNAL